MKFISVFSGIEAATVAWAPLGFEALAYSEIDKFPCDVLRYRYPNVPNRGDISKADWREYHGRADIVVGGSPCQSFSVAGQRAGLGGASGLVKEYFRVLREVRPRWFVWENVPGAFSSSNGDDFRFILQQWNDIGYCVAWRVLDAQYFGLAQRRKRVFAAGYIGDWRPPVKVLFEPESLSRHPATSHEVREGHSEKVGTLSANCGGFNKPAGNANELDFCVFTPSSHGAYREGVGTLRASGGDLGGGSENLVCYAIQGNCIDRSDSAGCNGCGWHEQQSYTLNTIDRPAVTAQNAVRRLTPLECERLMGFPDGYTDIPGATDSKRYKALGNSMAVPVMRWIGERIKFFGGY